MEQGINHVFGAIEKVTGTVIGGKFPIADDRTLQQEADGRDDAKQNNHPARWIEVAKQRQCQTENRNRPCRAIDHIGDQQNARIAVPCMGDFMGQHGTHLTR